MRASTRIILLIVALLAIQYVHAAQDKDAATTQPAQKPKAVQSEEVDARPAPPATKQEPVAPVSTPTPASAPITLPPIASPESVAAVATAVADLDSDIESLAAGHKSTASTLNTLSASISDGLRKLEGSGESHSRSLKSVEEQVRNAASTNSAIKTRLDALEKQLEKVQGMLKTLTEQQKEISAKAEAAAAKGKAASGSESRLAEVLANQKVIMERLANATAHWTFDHEALLAQAKATSLTWWGHLKKFGGRWVASAKANYPHLQAKAVEVAHLTMELALDLGAKSRVAAGVTRDELTTFLAQQGVPREHVHFATMSIMGVVSLLIALSLMLVLRAVCRCICCCRGSKRPSKPRRA